MYHSTVSVQVEQGESITLEDAAQITGTYKTKKTKQAAVFKGCIEIASGVQLPIYMFNKVTNSVPGQSFKLVRCRNCFRNYFYIPNVMILKL